MQIATFFLFLIFFLIFFLNYISCLYTEQDLFQQDLSLIEKKEKKKLERLLFIFKNRQPFSLLVDFLQVIFGVFLTHFLDP